MSLAHRKSLNKLEMNHQEQPKCEGETETPTSEEEHMLDKKYKLAFAILDEDGDGIVTRVQLEEFLKNKVGFQASETEFENILSELNADDSGTIYLEGFLKAMQRPHSISFKSDGKLFSALDADGDGVVGATDWQKMLLRCGIELSENEVTEVMDCVSSQSKKDDSDDDSFENSEESVYRLPEKKFSLQDEYATKPESSMEPKCSFSQTSLESEEMFRNDNINSSADDSDEIDDSDLIPGYDNSASPGDEA